MWPSPAPDGLGIQYEFSDGKNYAKKTFEFSKSGYLSHVTTEVTQNGVPAGHSIEWRGGFGDATVLNRAGEEHAVYYDPHESSFLSQGKLITKDAKSVKDGPVITSGDYSFAGLDDRFFAFVVLPKDNTSIKVETIKDDVPPARRRQGRDARRRRSRRRLGESPGRCSSDPRTSICCAKLIPSCSSSSTGAGTASSPSRSSWRCTG